MVDRSGHSLVECVPNFSEGRRPAVMNAIHQAAAEVPGATVLDRHADAVHNRMVLTIVGTVGPVAEAAFRSVARAAALIDLRHHQGVHPRIGAADVVPFVPLGSTSMTQCVELARRVGRRVAAELDLPVYLYGDAATRPARQRLPDIRQGEYETLRERILDDVRLQPDFGPPRLGPAGAVAIGARGFLIAYNVTLATGDLQVARAVARAIRESNGGLPAVQARGFPTAHADVVQVSINLLDSQRTPLHVVFERVVAEAAERGAQVVASELVGLAPTGALVDVASHYLRLPPLTASAAVEARLAEVMLAAPVDVDPS